VVISAGQAARLLTSVARPRLHAATGPGSPGLNGMPPLLVVVLWRGVIMLPARLPVPACRYGGALERALIRLGAKRRTAAAPATSQARPTPAQPQEAGEAAFK
jgi:hypothetical protein